MKFTTVAIALMLTSGAAVAETTPQMRPMQVRPVLELTGGLCPATKQYAIDWAGGYKTIGAFALPLKTGGLLNDCDAFVPAKSGFSFGYSSQSQADAAALASCEDLNAGNPNVGDCIIIGRLRPGPV